ncbi:membrane integrity-associated transporter subunit PqiC [Mixta calida]|uniref:membrane integrity-associated transporter subunit PqiC n=1 Tax=Mixta calida TaxID=665913 RepID=UPI00403ADD6E
MMKWMPLAMALALSACSSTTKTTMYQLPTGTSAPPPVTQSALLTETQLPLWVERVAVPDYLAGNGVVYQTSDVKYVIAANNLWASPLDQQLQQTLVTNLSNALPGRLISAAPLGELHDTLNVNVTGFHGRYDGQVVISGSWTLEHSGRITRQAFNLTLPQQEDGYDAMVRTLAAGWQQEAQRMAMAFSSLKNN